MKEDKEKKYAWGNKDSPKEEDIPRIIDMSSETHKPIKIDLKTLKDMGLIALSPELSKTETEDKPELDVKGGKVAELCPACNNEVYIHPMIDTCPECNAPMIACCMCEVACEDDCPDGIEEGISALEHWWQYNQDACHGDNKMKYQMQSHTFVKWIKKQYKKEIPDE